MLIVKLSELVYQIAVVKFSAIKAVKKAGFNTLKIENSFLVFSFSFAEPWYKNKDWAVMTPSFQTFPRSYQFRSVFFLVYSF